MTVRVLSVAEAEFAKAVDYYNNESPGLGYEFAAEVSAAAKRIRAHPLAWVIFSRKTRRCQLHRFPYAIVYHIENGDTIVIIAIMHMHRDPKRWRERIRKSGLK